jgi:hypothetical protein
VALVVVAFLVASAVLFVWPASDQPRRVDAILSLNGENEVAREAKAVALAKHGYAPLLLFSQGGNVADTGCPKVPGVSVVCFVPNPPHTFGEIKWAANYARRHHLRSIMIVPDQTQVTQARLLMQRCFSGEIVMVPASLGLLHLPLQVLYEWGAVAKALLTDQHC